MSSDLGLTNRAFCAVLLGAEEVLGKHGLAAVLRQANLAAYINNYPPSDLERGGHRAEFVTQIAQAIQSIYGVRGYRAILHRVGAIQAKHGIAQNPLVANAARIAITLLPAHLKVKIALEAAVKELNAQMNRQARIVEEGAAIIYEEPTCIYCLGVHGDKPICYSVAGFIHGLVVWALGSDAFTVEEIACRATGAAMCRFKIVLNE